VTWFLFWRGWRTSGTVLPVTPDRVVTVCARARIITVRPG